VVQADVGYTAKVKRRQAVTRSVRDGFSAGAPEKI
jgi:hypothetical protein